MAEKSEKLCNNMKKEGDKELNIANLREKIFSDCVLIKQLSGMNPEPKMIFVLTAHMYFYFDINV